MLANYWAAISSNFLGALDSASQSAEATLVPAEELRHHSYIARAAWASENVHRHKGEWEAARKLSDHGLDASPFDPRLLYTRTL